MLLLIIIIIAKFSLLHDLQLYLLQKFQVEESDVRIALAAGDMHDQLLVAYQLILDNRRINAEGIISFPSIHQLIRTEKPSIGCASSLSQLKFLDFLDQHN